MNDVKVVKIEAAPGKPVKDPIYGYRFPVILTLVDGRVIEGSDTARLLRDAKAKIAALPDENPVGVSAVFWNGRFGGLSRKFGLNFSGKGAALVPVEDF